MITAAASGFRKRNKGPEDGSVGSSLGVGTGAGAAGGGGGGSSRLALSRRQRRSLCQAAAVLAVVAGGCFLAAQLRLGGSAEALLHAASSSSSSSSSWPAWVASLFAPPARRGWAVATNVQTLRLDPHQPPQWDAVDRIHRLLAETEYAQHNQDCGRVLVYSQQHGAGFGSQVNQMLTAFLVALNEHRAFVVRPNFLTSYTCQANDTASTYGSCFDEDIIMGPPACQAKWAGPGGIKERLFGGAGAAALPQWDNNAASRDVALVEYKAAFLPSVRYHGDRPWNKDRPLAEWRYPVPVPVDEATEVKVKAEAEAPVYFPYAAWKAYAASRLWKPRDEVAQQIDAILTNHIMTDEKEREMQREEGKEGEKTKGSKLSPDAPAQLPAPALSPLERPLCALQVRRGDKHFEAPFEPLEKYMTLLTNATAEAGITCRTLFVATDDQGAVLPEIKERAAKAFPGGRVAWLTSEHGRAGHMQGAHDSAPAPTRAATTVELLAELTVLGRADVYVGAQSSNVAKLAVALRGAEGFGLRTMWSVDGPPTADLWELP